MSDVADQRFAPPQAYVSDVASSEVVLAGRWSRLGAAILDTLIAFAAGWAVAHLPVIGPILEAQTQARAADMWMWSPMTLVLGLGVFLVIQGWPLLTRGQTLGKMALKLRIVRSDGSKVDPWRMLGLRYGIAFVVNMNVIASMIYGLVDSLLIFRSSRKCLHDTIADTKVIKL